MATAFTRGAAAPRAVTPPNATAARDARFARVRAALADRGFDLIVTDGPLFIVCRWGRSRDLGDMDAVEAFARQVGVKP